MTNVTKAPSKKIVQKKAKKKTDLILAAYKLFLVHGVEQTSIDEIVKKAGIAKGTFYLYFRDKNDLVDQIIIKTSGEIILKVYEEQVAKGHDCFEDLVIDVLNEIIERLKDNHALLNLIHKNITWQLYQKALRETSGESILDLLKRDEARFNRNADVSDEELERRMFILLEMTTALTYTTVVRNEPMAIDALKPTLFDMIRRMLKISSP